jgi:MtN3 and saliva related transmembrane protein
MTEIIGYLAAICTTISFIPQVYKIIKTKDTSSISFSMYLIFNMGILSWLFYGILLESLPIILANSVTILLSGSVLFFKWRDIKNK